jgi:acyl-CoA thioester hydrolase
VSHDRARPGITITRELQWQDTDASGHQHHSVMIRWVEEAEGSLMAQLNLGNLFGRTPRVRYQVDYRSRLWYGDSVEIRLAVAHVGRSSLTFSFQVHGPRELAAEGEMTIVHTVSSSGGSAPWPPETRTALTAPARSIDISYI